MKLPETKITLPDESVFTRIPCPDSSRDTFSFRAVYSTATSDLITSSAFAGISASAANTGIAAARVNRRPAAAGISLRSMIAPKW